MKILHIINSLSYGGVETGVMKLASEQSKNKNYSITILCLGRTLNIRHNELPSNITIKNIPIKSNFKIESLNYLGILKFLILFFLLLKKDKFNLIHSHINLINAFTLSLSRLFSPKSKFISNTYTTHNFFKGKYINNFLQGLNKFLSSRLSDVCASDSQDSWDFCFGEESENKKIIIPMPIELINNLEKSKPNISINKDRPLVIGNIGRHVFQKNQIFLIKLLKKSKQLNFNWKLKIIGSGDLRDDLIRNSISSGLIDQIEFIDPISNLDSFYNEIDLFILPSLSESMPLTILEAQSFGIRCVASTNVTKDVAIVPFLVEFVDLDADLNCWIESITNLERKKLDISMIKKFLLQSQLDIVDITKRWDKIYND